MTTGEKIKTERKRLGLTQTELGQKLGVQKNAVSKWECGRVDDIPTSKIKAMASLFGVTHSYLVDDSQNIVPFGFDPLPDKVRIPLVGNIACGEPIIAEENIEEYIDAPTERHPDFALRCCGDSMIDDGIADGDIVYIKIQSEVKNGEIAAVRIGDEATLKHIYWDGKTLTLVPANKRMAPKTYSGEALDEIHIEGKAVGFTHWF